MIPLPSVKKLKCSALVIIDNEELYHQVHDILEKLNIAETRAFDCFDIVDKLSSDTIQIIITSTNFKENSVADILEEGLLLHEVCPIIVGIGDTPDTEELIKLIQTRKLMDYIQPFQLPRLFSYLKKIKHEVLQNELTLPIQNALKQGKFSEEKVGSVIQLGNLDSNIIHGPYPVKDDTDTSEITKPVAIKDDLPPHKTQTKLSDIIKNLYEKLKHGTLPFPEFLPFAHEIIKTARIPQLQENTFIEIIGKKIENENLKSLLALANRGYYHNSNTITCLEDAVKIHGIYRLALWAHLLNFGHFFRNIHFSFRNIIIEIAKNFIATAFLSLKIADYILMKEPSQFFVHGLYTNIGKPFLIHLLSEQETLRNEWRNAEKVLQYYHIPFGAALLKNWELDTKTILVCECHNHDSQAIQKAHPSQFEDIQKNVHIFHVAHFLAEDLGYRYLNSIHNESFRIENSMKYIGLDQEALDSITYDFIQYVDETIEVLELI